MVYSNENLEKSSVCKNCNFVLYSRNVYFEVIQLIFESASYFFINMKLYKIQSCSSAVIQIKLKDKKKLYLGTNAIYVDFKKFLICHLKAKEILLSTVYHIQMSYIILV